MKAFAALLFLVVIGVALAVDSAPKDQATARRDARFLGLFGGYGLGYGGYGYGGYGGYGYGGYGGYPYGYGGYLWG